VTRRNRRLAFVCRDDGRGIDMGAVRQVAAKRGLISTGKDVRSDDIVRLLLGGGITTSKTVTDVSGRGIGLHVVPEAIERPGGELGFSTTPGGGTTFELIVPPSLASMDALIVEARSSGVSMAIPLEAVRSTRRVVPEDISIGANGAIVMHDQKAIPFSPLP